MYPYVREIDKLLLKLTARKITRAAVMLPPQHGKTTLISRAFPAWYLGHFPDDSVLLGSYESEFAAEHGRAARAILEEYGEPLFGVSVDRRSHAADRWEIDGHKGGMRTAGVGAGLTGRRGNLIVIDDPVKSAEQAHSKAYRERVWDWYRAVIRTRLAPGGVILVVMTRWHEDDLLGRILKDGAVGEEWEVLKLPAIAEENDPLGRGIGEALNPHRYPVDFLKAQRAALGSYLFSALYQQSPQPSEGGFFRREWYRYFREIAVGGTHFFELYTGEGTKRISRSSCVIFQTVDLAASTRTSADFTVFATWALTPTGDLLLLDVFRARLEGVDQRIKFIERFGINQPSYSAVEAVAYQLTFIQELRRAGFPIRQLKAEGDKIARALPIAVMYEAGKVFHREGAPWLSEYELELLQFPRGEHDDQVDVAGYAGLEVTRKATGARGVVEKPEGW